MKKRAEAQKEEGADFHAIEAKWQREWEKAGIFKSKTGKGVKFYCLEMFPYPSGAGLHMGHTRNYAISDCIARVKRMQKFNVLYPTGYDAFGLPAENAAIANKADPKKWTYNNIELMKKQQKMLGLSYDWDREIRTCDPDYYKWEQLFFLKMLEKGLAYRKKSKVNWCPSCKTVLANEQVHEGACWRCYSKVEERELEQWFLKITDYANELVDSLDKLNWPEKVKIMQRNWIGRSEGSEVVFKITGSKEEIRIFTTRIDTLFGCTFIAISPEHELIDQLITKEKKKEVLAFLKKVKAKSLQEREEKGKEGVFTGSYAINPANGKKIPIYIGEYVLSEYGTGAVMCVPAHDKRDFEFAKKHKIPMLNVIIPEEDVDEECFIEDGILENSGEFNELKSVEAREKMTEWLAKKKLASFRTNFKLKDWLISRQRYWGCPIPVIYCKKCGIVPVPEEQLPVKLPDAKKVKFGKGNPLETNSSFVNIKCPKCKGPAKRETDTMDTFVDSSWYFLRYCSPKENKKPFNNEVGFWMPVDFYIGGIEHACMHLIYSRFFTKALNDLGYVDLREPFSKLICQGMVTLGGSAMSKSRGNVVDPLTIIKKYSADTARVFILFAALPEKELEWNDKGVEGIFRFLNRVYRLQDSKSSGGDWDNFVASKTQRLIKQITDDIDNLRLSIALTNLMEFANLLEKYKGKISAKTFKESYKTLILLLAPFAPHLCEEIWHNLGEKGFVSMATWLIFNEKKIDEAAEKAGEAVEKTIEDVNHIIQLTGKKPEKIYLYTLPKELGMFKDASDFLSQQLGAEVTIFSVADKKKHDPQGKAGKAKPGKPAIYIE